MNFGLNFSTASQSIWDTGEAFRFTDNRLIGRNFPDRTISRGFTIPVPFAPDPRAVFSATIGAQTGLQSILNLNGGSINASIPVNLTLTLPDRPVNIGESFTIQSGFSFGSGATFTTTSPNASYALDLVFRLLANLDIDPESLPDINIDTTRNLVRFDTQTGTLQKTGPLGDLNVKFPIVTTTGALSGPNELSDFETDQFLKGSLDLDGVATTLLGLPPLEDRKSIPLPGPEGSITYNLLDAGATATLSLS